MGVAAKRHSAWPVLFWPLKVLWKLVTFIAELTGCIAAILLGLLLMAVGWFLCLTVVGSVVGIPLFVLGLLLLIRGLY